MRDSVRIVGVGVMAIVEEIVRVVVGVEERRCGGGDAFHFI